jgi:hypothetical protein
MLWEKRKKKLILADNAREEEREREIGAKVSYFGDD